MRSLVGTIILDKFLSKLTTYSPIEGAVEKITALRKRYENLASSVTRYESRVAKQALQLEKMNHPKKYDGNCEKMKHIENVSDLERTTTPRQARITIEDVKREEQAIRLLEENKRYLEDRVTGIERDLGGLLR